MLDAEQNGDSTSIQQASLLKVLQLLVQNIKQHDERDNDEVHKIACNACGKSPIRGDRYKCLQCHDFDLCANCFESRKEPKEHKSGHLLVHLRLPNQLFGRTFNNSNLTIEKLKQLYAHEKHEAITCDGCHEEGFTGLRFKCDTCLNYDLCYRCARTGVVTKDHKSTHPLILTSHRIIVQISVDDIQLIQKLGSGGFGKSLIYAD